MDTYEATKTVMSRIQSLDPENASKIMGYILIQDQGEKEMIRLAFSPEALLLSYINEAKVRLGLSSSNPLSYPIMPNNPFPQNSPRIMIPNNAFHLSNPSPPVPIFQRSRPRPIPDTAVQDNSNTVTNNNFGDEFLFHDNSVVDPIMSPGGRSDSLVFPYGEDANSGSSPHPHPFHKRSCSVNDAAFLSNLDEGGVGNGFLWRPCMYFSRGFCKNGSTCKFVHGDANPIDVGSPSKTGSGFDELFRMKTLQQRFAFMASGAHHPFAYNKCMDSLNENLRFQPDSANSSSRQIYLTFPADSTFKEEDVSSYFSMFGPVQDVRIPYQQKRMFGFVTFVYPETVKLILAKGNPHFLCDSRVLVKPYKEKGKFREKKQQERGEYSGCLSPSGVDSGEHFDMPFGSRMMLSPRQMMLRRKLEHDADLQHAIELQGRRIMNLQLMDLKNENHNYHFVQSFPAGIPYSSPRQSQMLMNQHFVSREDSEEFDGGQEGDVAADEKLVLDGNESLSINNNVDCGNHQHRGNSDDSDPHQSLDYILPDNLFSSPTKSAAERQRVLTEASPKANDGMPVASTPSSNDPLLPNSSPLTMASLKSCYLQMPRYFPAFILLSTFTL
ncbi:hypothetical protein DH2020_000975 [Rehmannia glutinosa]|uniref:Zinc finger CCCH domain-containing protein n=1 Tax=Rehmannia glutinosa TaxID=99300 RepID=A0ABR0XYD8_REHGL